MYMQLAANEQEHFAYDLVTALETVNNKIAYLRLEKEQLEKELIATIGHSLEGSKTYDVGDKLVTLKTEMIYSLNKKAYVDESINIPEEFNPFTQKITYEVNKKKFNEFEKSAPLKVRRLLGELVEKKPAKAAVTIKVRA